MLCICNALNLTRFAIRFLQSISIASFTNNTREDFHNEGKEVIDKSFLARVSFGSCRSIDNIQTNS